MIQGNGRKFYLEIDVYEAAIQRLRKLFAEFDNVYVAFSGGKDSGFLLNLVIDFLRREYPGRKVGVYHLDYEGQYQATTDYVTEMMTTNLDVIEPYWCCMPISAQCAASMRQTDWTPWHPEQKEIWCRPMPDYPCVINLDNHPFGEKFILNMDGYDFDGVFCDWYRAAHGGGKTAVLVGIRAQESLHRYCAIANKEKMWADWKWTSEIRSDRTYAAYPLYDWTVDDIWTGHARFNYPYNKLYDLMHLAGLKLHDMRVASPFNDCALGSLQLYRALEPDTWAKLVGRVNGANFAAIYGGTKALGFKSITLPKGHTWKSYLDFLLSTLPDEIRELYLRKFNFSHKYWLELGGAVTLDTLAEIEQDGRVKIEKLGVPKDKRARTRDAEVVRFAEYPDDLEITKFNEVPTYKRMCITILKNDYSCKFMGFGQTKYELERRRAALAKYADL